VPLSWPKNWDALVSGDECSVCASLRGDAPYGDPVIYESQWTIAYLRQHDIQRGYAIVVWRASHVVEPLDLSNEAACAYWADVLRVGRALREHFAPKKLNYETQGNSEPHLHTHVVPRYDRDPNPRGGFPFWKVHDPPLIPADELAPDVAALRALLAALVSDL
jgi:diadenosine tetraphosphate (Ap4A) HIT family hydrolase